MIPPLNSDCLAACVWKCRNGLYFPTKKASVPLKGQKLNIILKYSKTSAVPPNLSSHDHSLMYYHTHLLDNGRESRQHLLPLYGFKLPSQVHSVKTLTAAIPPSAALLGINILTYSSCSSVLLLYHSIVMFVCFVKKFFLLFYSVIHICETYHRQLF